MTDVELVQRALAGDMPAIEQLHATYAASMLAHARRLGAGQDAEDVVQELFCRLAEGRGWHVTPEASPPDGTIHAFVAKMTRGFVDPRPWRRKYHGELSECRDPAPMWAWAHETPEDRVLRLERTAKLAWAICALPQRLREVARLRYVECLPGPIIAQQLGLKSTTIPDYLASIRERLRLVLGVVYALPPPGRSGHVRFDRKRSHTQGREHYNAKRRRARSKASQQMFRIRGESRGAA